MDPQENSMVALELENVTKRFGSKIAVEDITFKIREGERIALIGENGAGKSTTLKISSGLLRPDTGKVRIFGYLPSSYDARKLLGYLPEDASPYLNLSVIENLEYIGAIRSVENLDDRIDELVTVLSLKEFLKSKPLSLSRGNRQKLCLALSIIHRPKLAIMDEPLNYLDIPTQERVMEYLNSLDSSFLISTHIFSIARRLTQKVIIISRGKKIWEGMVSELEDSAGFGKSVESIISELMRNVS
ncbi:ABC transporter ATP-binding protein [Caldiplasma sukawensis]